MQDKVTIKIYNSPFERAEEFKYLGTILDFKLSPCSVCCILSFG